jgi:REP element-mobilizing transposase RayT
VRDRIPIFKRDDCCQEFLKVFRDLLHEWPAKLIAYVLMPDHVHLIVNPKDGRIQEFTGKLKGLSANRIVEVTGETSSNWNSRITVRRTKFGRRVSKLNRCGALG